MEREDFLMAYFLLKKKKKNTIPKHILKKKKPSTLIRVIRKNKNLPREGERERESTHSFVWEKYELNGKRYQIYKK